MCRNWSPNVMRGRAVEEAGEKKLDSVARIKHKKKRKRNPLHTKGLGYANPGPPLCPER